MRTNKLFEKMNDCLKFTRSTDETRPFLCGVIHMESMKALVSCNGYMATILKSGYCEELKNQIIDDDFQVVRRDYPKIEPLMPDFSKLSKEVYKIEKRHYVKSKDLVKIYFCKDGVIKQDQPEEYLFALDARWLKILADGSTYNVLYSTNLNPVYFDVTGSEDFNNFCLIMPVKA